MHLLLSPVPFLLCFAIFVHPVSVQRSAPPCFAHLLLSPVPLLLCTADFVHPGSVHRRRAMFVGMCTIKLISPLSPLGPLGLPDVTRH